MLVRRCAPFVLILAALVMAPSSASASSPLPTTVVIDASAPPAASEPPATSVSAPEEPAPSVAAAPAAVATPRPSVAPATEEKPVARLTSSLVETAPARGGGHQRDRTRPRPGRTRSAEPSASAQTAPSSAAGGVRPAGSDDTGPTGPEPILLWGIGAIGGAALVGSTWLLVARRREPAVDAVAAEGVAYRGIPSIEQRARRRARLRQDEDPILAGLGLDDASRAPSPTSRRGGRPRP